MILRALIVFLLCSSCSFGLELSDLTAPKPLEGRLSNTDKVETPKVKNEIISEKKAYIDSTSKQVENNIENATNSEINSNYADLSLKRLAQDISYEIDEDQMKINSDLAILWAATSNRSETMKYTIYKLSNPDEDKPNESTMKKILRPLANFSSIAGASVAGNPFAATGALVGGGLVNAFMKDDKEVNYRFSKVSDADMVLLVRKIDALQKKLLDLYVDYKTKQQLFKLTEDNFKKREEIYKYSEGKTKQELLIADVYYRNAKANMQKALDDYNTSRAILENLVGEEALKKIEE
ncbi:hypothetical protein IJ425_04560 [bacterium]|nr:hypothetical protein [bacterium]